MSVVHSVLGLTEGAKQITSDEHNAKQQHALIQPASHALAQGGGAQNCVLAVGGLRIGRHIDLIHVGQLKSPRE